MDKEIQISTVCYGVTERVVKNGGNSGRIFVPKGWAGKKVTVLLMEPLEE